MILSNTSQTSIEVVLAGAVTTNQLVCTAGWIDTPSQDFASGQQSVLTNDTTAVELVPAIEDTFRREVKFINIYNADTATATVIIRVNVGASTSILQKVVLRSGYTLCYEDNRGWYTLNADGAIVNTTTGYQGYTLIAWGGGSIAPSDNATYYFGAPQLATNTTPNVKKVYIPKTGTIKAAYLTFNVLTTLGSSETFSAWIRKNNTTDTLISSACTMDSANPVFSNTALNIAVVAGDYIEIKFTTPTWLVNPTGVNEACTLYIE